MKWEPFYLCDAPPAGRYLIQRSDSSWHPALWCPNELKWTYEDSSGRINDVFYYMEIILHA